MPRLELKRRSGSPQSPACGPLEKRQFHRIQQKAVTSSINENLSTRNHHCSKNKKMPIHPQQGSQFLFPSHALMLQPELHSHRVKIALVKTFLAMRLLQCLTFIPTYHLITTQRCRPSEGTRKLIKIFPAATLEISQSSFLANQRVGSPKIGLNKS